MSVEITFSEDGLTAHANNERGQNARLSWHNHSQIPAIEKLESIFSRIFSKEDFSQFKYKKFELPCNKTLLLASIKQDSSNDAILWFGAKGLSIPYTDGKLDFSKKSLVNASWLRFGLGGRQNYRFVDLRDRKESKL